MKLTFTSLDIKYIVAELQKSVVGLRVNQIYDVDHKTYLIKLQKPDHKAVLLLESAARLHTTDYQWPKNPAPSGFSMKLRKHLKNKRLECVQQLGVDRVIQLTFGSGTAQHHLIIELYDRGNITLTDAEYTILIILRPRKDGEETRFAAHETYPIESFRSARPPPTLEKISEVVAAAKPNLNLKKVLNPLLDCGGGVVEHALTVYGLAGLTVQHVKNDNEKLCALVDAAKSAQLYMEENRTDDHGYIIQREVKRGALEGEASTIVLFEEFHPMLYEQHKNLPHLKYDSFNQACDEFFQQLESQKIEQRAVQQERDALKKLDNVRTDHTSRVAALKKLQEDDTKKGQLIELNLSLVDEAITEMRAALADQLDWKDIEEHLNEAQSKGVPVAMAIKSLNFATNSITMMLSDPYSREDDDLFLDSDEEREEGCESESVRPTTVTIDLDLSAYANATRYYSERRKASAKVEKTLAASAAALKSATKKTKEQLKEVQKTTSINKLRKVHWFEKFLWFISSENYLILAGHDQQQNEQLVKRHLKPNDVYIHADLHGASSVVVKNPTPNAPVPPATLHQAGVMALCYSRAWTEKVVTSAWWVWGHQVSKTAPTGEYLTTGSFMVRGKKNFLPPAHLVYGFGFLFRLEESSIFRHEGERKVKGLEELEKIPKIEEETNEDELEIEGNDNDQEEENEDRKEINTIKEEVEDTIDEMNKNVEGIKIDENSKAGDSNDEGEDDDADNSDSKSDTVEFPDTQVEMRHVHGDTYAVSTSEVASTKPMSKETTVNGDEEDSNKRRSSKSKSKVGKKEAQMEKSTAKSNNNDSDNKNNSTSQGSQLKRGQKSRLKKMKTKYKDQDEEERELMMQILQSAGAKKEPKRQKGKKGKKQVNAQRQQQQQPLSEKVEKKTEDGTEKNNEEKKMTEGSKTEKNNDENKEKHDDDGGEEEEDEGTTLADDLAILSALTGQPDPEDELLYCIPVCAPYPALNNYKYKVKLTPGTGKKGKACKTAVSLFLSMKPQNLRECDLIRAVRDSDLGRNMPGKVKVSAPNISKVRK